MAAVTVEGTVVEEEKVDLEIPQEKVDVKKADEAEPESAGGCDVCLPPNGLIGCGAYDYKYLCLPSMPWSRGGVAPPQFLGKDARLPLLLALVMGFQHALAIGTIAALFLHLLLPEDRVLDEEKEHYPRAFSDGEIAYET